PPAGGQIIKLLRRFVLEHDAVCIRRVLKLGVGDLRVSRLPVEQDDFSRLVTVKNVRSRTLRICSWRDKFFESAPLFILRHLGHFRRQLFRRRPLTIEFPGRQPLLTDREVVSGGTLVIEQWPLRVYHIFQIRIRNNRKGWLAIHAQQNRRPITDKNLWWIVIQLYASRGLLLWRGRDQMQQGSLEG